MARAARRKPTESSQKPLAFIHIPKTAGTSIIEAVSRNFAVDEVCRIERLDRPPAAVGAEIEAAIASDKRFICGHFSYRAIAHLRDELDVFTLLRHPVQRVASLYRFWRTQLPGEDASEAARFVCHMARAVNFDVFVELRHPLIVSAARDEMCKMLCGTVSQHPNGLESSELFQSARQTLAGIRFGIASEMDVSLRLLSRQLQVNLLEAPRLNGTDHSAMPNAAERARERVLLHNLGDTMLFQHASDLFARTVRRAAIESLFDEIGERALTPLVRDQNRGFRWDASMSVAGADWNEREALPDGSFYRFTSGPETVAFFPNRFGRGEFSIEVEARFFNTLGMVDGNGAMQPGGALAFELDGLPVRWEAVPSGEAGAIFRIDVPPEAGRGPVVALSIRSPYGVSPALFGSPDKRTLVAAVSAIRFAPPRPH